MLHYLDNKQVGACVCLWLDDKYNDTGYHASFSNSPDQNWTPFILVPIVCDNQLSALEGDPECVHLNAVVFACVHACIFCMHAPLTQTLK